MGVCGLPKGILVSHFQQHFFEEPMISGSASEASAMSPEPKCGSGTVFFTGCNGRCVFCQNYKISQSRDSGSRVSFEELFEICLELIDSGARNINFVSPTPYTGLLVEFLEKFKGKIRVPIVWNSNGYERAETIRGLRGLVDVYLPDLKYFDDKLALKYSKMPGYFGFASDAVKEMLDQVGYPEIGKNGFIKKGLIIRHLVLPGCLSDSKKVLKWIRNELGKEAFVSLMAQYYPTHKACEFPEINRRLNSDEYDEIVDYFVDLGFEDGLIQELESADKKYTPDFK